MSKTCQVLALLVAFAGVGFAPAPFPKTQRQQEDPTDVTGTWEFELWETSGQRHQSLETAYQVEMTKESYVFVGKNGGHRSVYQMRLDPSFSPRAFT